MRDDEKLINLTNMLDTLISTCKSEINITDKIISKETNTRKINILNKEKMYWQGKLEVAEYTKKFAE